MREFTRLIFSSTTQLSNNGILIGIVSVPPNPQSTRGLRSHHHHFPLAICMEEAATVSFPLAFFFSPLFPIILAAALSIKLLFRQWHSSPSLSWRGELDPAAAIPCSSVAWRRQWRWVCLSLLFSPSPFQFFSHSTFFQLNRSSVGRAGRPPSVNTGITGPVAAIPACDSPADGDGSEFSPPFYFPPHPTDFFSQRLFSN